MSDSSKLVHSQISERIIGAGMTVLNELGPGLDEKIYENALVLELLHRGAHVEQQQDFVVHYRGHIVGTLRPDLLVDRQVILDTKVVECFHENHIAKMLAYLAITRFQLGLFLNFKYPTLKWKRIVLSRERLLDDDPYIPEETADNADERG